MKMYDEPTVRLMLSLTLWFGALCGAGLMFTVMLIIWLLKG